MILRRFRCWAPIADGVDRLAERHDAGKALSRDEEAKLLAEVSQTGSPALLPLFVVSLDTGLRASEVRSLRQRDLTLEWDSGVIASGHLVVSKSKTAAGTGRVVPLTQRACGALTLWLARFPNAAPESYVFPRHKITLAGGKKPHLYDIALDKPMVGWKRAWRSALKDAGMTLRWHDLRHTFVTRLCESPRVSEQTIRSLAGHVSQQMLQRYSHVRNQAKLDAIAELERTLEGEEGVQKRAQSPEDVPALPN